ncbi:biopolymer transporter ExbD [Rhodobacteraceae bacterium RKSG542]|uniref:ExbD/TolR family protein n=1 Tax=Pseudovibrio flavus TaxID=2529854 RepID=UPI0012BBD07A|nr:biopolymer transporter ExbD [Pseudovibrio flavus]MTI17305.1 biopolymer transporter ExbD [Pseudovibrio flavus]
MKLASRRRRVVAPALTSLIDVIFLLLMFFMLSSTFAYYQRLDLSAGAGSAKASASPPVVIAVQGEGFVELGGQRVPVEALSGLLEAKDLPAEQTLAVLSSKGASVQDLVAVLEAIEMAGFKASLVTSSKPEEPK